jgi:PadR family transcriptional regulator, regulatory protein PadR
LRSHLPDDSFRAGVRSPAAKDSGLAESIQTQLRKGVLELCVLTLLSRADAYGYEIASRLMQDVGMGEGTIYPLMRRMQNDGLVSTYLQESGSGPPRKYYKLTKSGAQALKSQSAEWLTFEAAVRKILGEVT